MLNDLDRMYILIHEYTVEGELYQEAQTSVAAAASWTGAVELELVKVTRIFVPKT